MSEISASSLGGLEVSMVIRHFPPANKKGNLRVAALLLSCLAKDSSSALRKDVLVDPLC
jgi:hypothetical protein